MFVLLKSLTDYLNDAFRISSATFASFTPEDSLGPSVSSVNINSYQLNYAHPCHRAPVGFASSEPKWFHRPTHAADPYGLQAEPTGTAPLHRIHKLTLLTLKLFLTLTCLVAIGAHLIAIFHHYHQQYRSAQSSSQGQSRPCSSYAMLNLTEVSSQQLHVIAEVIF